MDRWQPPVEFENALHAQLLDGRVIHQHVFFVEPVQRQWAELAPEVDLPTPLEAALERLPRAHEGAGTVAGTGLALSRASGTGFEPPAASELAVAAESLRLLERTGLHFLVELTVGLLIVGAPPSPLPPAAVVLEADADALATAERILAAAARALVRQWSKVELSFAPADAALAEEADALAAAFADCVLAELLRRLGCEKTADAAIAAEHSIRLAALRARGGEFDRWLTGPRDLALTRELLCCWYPCWRRSRFIFGGSPFDQLAALPLHGSKAASGEIACAAE